MGTAPDSIGWVSEADLLRIARVARSTRRHWARKQLVTDPGNGRYRERDVVETVVLDLLVRATGFADAALAWGQHGGAVLDSILSASTTPGEQLDLVVSVELADLSLARTDSEVGSTARGGGQPRAFLVVPLAAALAEARSAFWTFAGRSRAPTDRRRRQRPRGKRRSRG